MKKLIAENYTSIEERIINLPEEEPEKKNIRMKNKK